MGYAGLSPGGRRERQRPSRPQVGGSVPIRRRGKRVPQERQVGCRTIRYQAEGHRRLGLSKVSHEERLACWTETVLPRFGSSETGGICKLGAWRGVVPTCGGTQPERSER